MNPAQSQTRNVCGRAGQVAVRTRSMWLLLGGSDVQEPQAGDADRLEINERAAVPCGGCLAVEERVQRNRLRDEVE